MSEFVKMSINKIYEYFLRRLILVLVLLVFILLLISGISKSPLDSLYNLFVMPLTKSKYVWHIFERSTPMIFTGLAFCMILSVNEFNLSVEGIFFFGGLVASLMGVYLEFPKPIHVLLSVTAAAILGIFVMFILSILKLKLQLPMMVISLMTNYILLNIGLDFLTNRFRDKSFPYTATYPFSDTAKLPIINYNTSYALIVAWSLAVLLAIVIYKTKFGYKVRLVGSNIKFSRFWGVNVSHIILICQIIGGALAGIGGSVEILSCYERFRWTQLPGYGWTGITIAIMVNNNPLFVPLVAMLFAYLEVGCEFMLMYTNIQPEIFDIIKFAFLLLFSSKYILKGKHGSAEIRET